MINEFNILLTTWEAKNNVICELMKIGESSIIFEPAFNRVSE